MTELGDERLPQRFWDKVQVVESGCWEWTGWDVHGYGMYRHFGRDQRAHRVAYEVLVQQIPYGLECDHLCRVRRCVNPAHVEAVTHKENVRRAPRVTYREDNQSCKAGRHKITRDSVYLDSRGRYHCRGCKGESNTRYRDANRDKIQALGRARYHAKRLAACLP